MSPNQTRDGAPDYWERLVSALTESILIVDASGGILYANNEAGRIFGREKSELIGQPFSHPIDTESNTEIPIRHATIRDISVEMRVAKGAWKEREAWVVSLRDITAEAEIGKIKAINKVGGLAAGHGIVLVDLSGRLIEVNDGFCQITGYARSELLNRSIQFITHPDDVTVSEAMSAELLAGKEAPYELEKRYIHKDGRHVPVRINVGIARDPEGKPICFVGHVQDLTEGKRATRALKTLSAALKMAALATNQDMLLQSVCDVIVTTGGYRMAWVGVGEQDSKRSVRPIARSGHDAERLDDIEIVWADVPNGRGPTGTAIRTGTIQVTQDFRSNPAIMPWRDSTSERNVQSGISIPLKKSTEIFGALSIYASEPFAFGAAETDVLVELAETITRQLSMIETEAAQEKMATRLRRNLAATIDAISTTLEMRDPYTSGHQHRVAILSYAMARAMRLSTEEATGIYFAGMVHDIGKVNVPAEILSKSGRLSKIEMDLVRTHSQSGYDILKGVDFPWPVAQMVLQHHERLDGSGYPNGHKDSELLRGSKILAVADVVEAMITHRPYRPAWDLDVALGEIERNKGILYDTAAVDACLTLFRDNAFSFDQENRPPLIA